MSVTALVSPPRLGNVPLRNANQQRAVTVAVPQADMLAPVDTNVVEAQEDRADPVVVSHGKREHPRAHKNPKENPKVSGPRLNPSAKKCHHQLHLSLQMSR
jgi:hypothetical protein